MALGRSENPGGRVVMWWAQYPPHLYLNRVNLGKRMGQSLESEGDRSPCSDGPDMVEGAHDFVYICLDF